MKFDIAGMIVAAVVAALVAILVMMAPAVFAAKVAVEIYRHDESGEMIYCESGDLSNSGMHTYMGSGTIDADKAVAC